MSVCASLMSETQNRQETNERFLYFGRQVSEPFNGKQQ